MIEETRDEHVGDAAALLDDWLGLAGYLAEAIAADDVTVDTARAELAAAASGVAERRALAQAAEVATIQLGPESLAASLLRWASSQGALTAEVA
jgi:hypothetical protein